MVLQHYRAAILGYEKTASSCLMASLGCVLKKLNKNTCSLSPNKFTAEMLAHVSVTDFNQEISIFPLFVIFPD